MCLKQQNKMLQNCQNTLPKFLEHSVSFSFFYLPMRNASSFLHDWNIHVYSSTKIIQKKKKKMAATKKTVPQSR